MNKRESIVRAKLKAAHQEERIQKWKEHFKNLLGNFPKVTGKPITKIINNQLDIKLGHFTQEELDVELTKIKNRKVAGLDDIPPEVRKTRKSDDLLLRFCNAVYNQNTIENCILPLLKKGDLGITKNYRSITLTSKATSVYNRIESEIVKSL